MVLRFLTKTFSNNALHNIPYCQYVGRCAIDMCAKLKKMYTLPKCVLLKTRNRFMDGALLEC